MNKEKLLEELQQGIIVVSFTKINGDRRDMHCTLNSELIPATPLNEDTTPTDKVKKVRKENPDVQRVYDINAKAWRSFRWDSIICSM